MAERAKAPKKRYATLHRFLNGITIFCVLITIIGGGVAGARTTTILWRSFLVTAILFVLWRILIRSWASWEELRDARNRARQR